MQMIVIAAIALIVLLVVIAVFYNQIKEVVEGFQEARERGKVCETGILGNEKCVLQSECDGEIVPRICEEEGTICCRKTDNSEK